MSHVAQSSCGTLCNFSVLGWALPSMTFFYLILFFIFNCKFGALPKNNGPNSMSFQFLTGGRLTQILHLPPT